MGRLGLELLGRDAAIARDVVSEIHGRLVGCTGIAGFETIDRVLEVDQTPIGKTPRSCPATYIGVWDAIRKLFTETLEAKARGYTAGGKVVCAGPPELLVARGTYAYRGGFAAGAGAGVVGQAARC